MLRNATNVDWIYCIHVIKNHGIDLLLRCWNMTEKLCLCQQNNWGFLLKPFVERCNIYMAIWNLIALMIECRKSKVSTNWAVKASIQSESDCNSEFGSLENIWLASYVFTLQKFLISLAKLIFLLCRNMRSINHFQSNSKDQYPEHLGSFWIGWCIYERFDEYWMVHSCRKA